MYSDNNSFAASSDMQRQTPARTGGGVSLGIDLGTTRSAAAYVDANGHVACVPNAQGDLLTPSCVYVDDSGHVQVGSAAQLAMTSSPDRVIEAFKRQLGQPSWSWRIDQRLMTAEALSAEILKQLVADAQRVVGPVDSVVISVPAYFGDRERSATLRAAELAGLHVRSLINEPTAAALAGAFEAYLEAGGDGHDLTSAVIASTAPGINVVCDLGGGTFDVTVIRIDGSNFDILATHGTRLGGRDFDDVIIEEMVRHLFQQNAPDPHHDPFARTRMRMAAERAKNALTVRNDTNIPAPYDQAPVMALSRGRFEDLSSDLIDQARDVIDTVLADADLDWYGVEELLMVGGASRIPAFRRMVTQLSGKSPTLRIQPDLMIAHGAAVYAAILRVQQGSVAPTPKRVDGPVPTAVASGAPVSGTVATAVETTEGTTEDTHRTFESTEGFAPTTADDTQGFGPAFDAAAQSVRLHEVTSQALGVIVRSPRENRKVNAVLIPRNSRLPATESRTFVTRHANQRRVRLRIVEGDERDPACCTPIGECVIDPLPPNLAKGTPVEVTFAYDPAGLVQVRAVETTTQTSAVAILDRPCADAASAPPSPIDELADAIAQLRQH